MPTTRTTPARRAAALAATLAAVVASVLTTPACSSSDDEPSKTTTSTSADDTTTTAATTTEPTGEDAGAAAPDGLAAWARPYETPGAKLATVEGDGFTVEVYQVGTATAPDDGLFVHPDTSEPILHEGDELVFVNYVFTNTSDETIPLPYSLVDMDPRYATWGWIQGMDSVADAELFTEMRLVRDPISPEAGDAPFRWEPGTSFAMGDNFVYQPRGAITFEATVVPADEDGGLVHDDTKKAKVETTIA